MIISGFVNYVIVGVSGHYRKALARILIHRRFEFGKVNFNLVPEVLGRDVLRALVEYLKDP